MNEKNGESSRAGERYRARMEMQPTGSSEAGPSTQQRKVRTVPREFSSHSDSMMKSTASLVFCMTARDNC